ncbi:carbohydrate ABC transporter permease [Streptomyces sp. ISL-90]|nr:carbohydrate ABC transporter permease [Streptomyces sp. ISL-90]
MKRHVAARHVTGIIAILVSAILFLVPFGFIVVQTFKTGPEAARLDFGLPTQFVFFDNVARVFETRDFMLVTAFINSTILTVLSVSIMVVLSAMIGWVLARRPSRWNGLISFLILAGLIVPPAIVPTAWVMQRLGIFNTIGGLALVEVAYGMAFCILLFRAFVSTIPRELDEAATIDGAGPIRLFFRIGFPLLRGVIVTAIVVQSVAVFNDFANPLYFLPGERNATVQLTLYNFQSQFQTTWNLLFTNILLITIPPLLMYIFFNRQIVAGLTSGAVKG